jgi:hypothetical protein
MTAVSRDNSDANSYDWVPERYKYLIDSPADRYKVRKRFYRKYGIAPKEKRSLRGWIEKVLTCREGYGRSELDFLAWEIRRGVLNSPTGLTQQGSNWWRNVNLKFIVTSETARDIHEGRHKPDEEITNEIRLWLEYIVHRTEESWYRAHNASIVRAYLDFSADAHGESPFEQTFMNEVLYRVLYAQAMVEDATAFGESGLVAANPMLPAVDIMVSIPAFYPDNYQLSKQDIQNVMHKGHSVGGDLERDFDEYLVYPHIPALYESAAKWVNISELTDLQKNGKPIYPFTTSSLIVKRTS